MTSVAGADEVAGALCTYTQRNDGARALDLDPTPGSFVFVVSEGLIVELTHIANVAPGWHDFRGWLALTHPDDLALMHRDAEMIRDSRFTPESIALWEQRTADWAASIS